MWITVIVTSWLLIMSAMDIRNRSVPVWVLGIGGMLAVLVSVYQCIEGTQGYSRMLCGVVPGVVLLIIAFATKKAGYGDGIVLSIVGMLTGAEQVLLIFGVSLFMVSVSSLILLILRKVTRNTRIPYLPFLTTAWVLVNLI